MVMNWSLYSLLEEVEPLETRRAKPSDINALSSLEEQFDPADRVSLRSWRRFLKGPASVWVVEIDNCVQAGAVVLYRRGVSLARLYSLSVAKRHWGQGLAQSLLTAATSEATFRGCIGLALEVRETNLRAISLYERFGFAIQGEKIGYYADGEKALRMIYPLQAEKASPE